MDELTSRTALCSSVASRYSTIAASVPSPARSTRPYCFGSSARTRAPSPRRRSGGGSSTSSRRSPGVSSGVSPESTRTSSARPSRAARAQRTASPVPRGSSCTATSIPSKAAAVVGRRDDDERIDAERPRRREHPVDHPSSEDRMQVLRDVASACACRGRPPSRRLRASSHRSPPRRLGRQDSNLGSRDQNPLPYHLATPQSERHLATHDGRPPSIGRTTNVRRNPRAASARPNRARLRPRIARRRPALRPVTSARNAPAASSSDASGDEARSFVRKRGEVVRRRDRARARPRSACSRARRSRRPRRGRRSGGRRRPSSLRLAGRDDEDHRVVGRQAESARARAVARPELRSRRRGRTARPRRRGPRRDASSSGASGSSSDSFASAERGRRIAAPAAEARSDRDPLLDTDAPARLDTRRSREGLERAADDRVLGEPFDDKRLRSLDRDRVVQVDQLQDGRDVVLSVLRALRRRERG